MHAVANGSPPSINNALTVILKAFENIERDVILESWIIFSPTTSTLFCGLHPNFETNANAFKELAQKGMVITYLLSISTFGIQEGAKQKTCFARRTTLTPSKSIARAIADICGVEPGAFTRFSNVSSFDVDNK